MLRLTLMALVFSISTPSFAQTSETDKGHNSSSTYGSDTSYGSHTTFEKTDGVADQLQLAEHPDLTAALAAGGEPVVATVLGVVCDFCATAMKKTFGKREEVAAVYVDLDDKTLNLVLKPGARLEDDMIRKLVKKSGYKIDRWSRVP